MKKVFVKNRNYQEILIVLCILIDILLYGIFIYTYRDIDFPT